MEQTQSTLTGEHAESEALLMVTFKLGDSDGSGAKTQI